MRLHRPAWPLLLVILGSCGSNAPQPASTPPSPQAAPAATAPATPEDVLAQAQLALERTDFAAARTGFEGLTAHPTLGAEARLGLLKHAWMTGDYAFAARSDAEVDASEATREQAALLKARAHRVQGQLELALKALDPLVAANHLEAKLLRGELLLEKGERQAAEPELMSLIDAYNEDAITSQDGHGLSLVGRAAQLLRSPEDANDAYNQAEQAAEASLQTLLWRAELFLDNHDPDQAEAVLSELLDRAPNHPEALVWLANVRLEEALDFDEANRLIDQALGLNPRLPRAFAVRAAIALRDMDLEAATAHIQAGLEINPRDLTLLSLLGAKHFLADDTERFEQLKQQVFKLNAQYARFFTIVGIYAEWEHRYDQIVELMREAVNIDHDDAKAHAQLGLNLIRGGDDRGGLHSLRTAFAKDPFNVRVYNTLNLYEKVIPTAYVDVPSELFRFRYPREERAVLERYVPALMTRAWAKMTEAYDFTPSKPIGIELYAERENFAIRTSGLPHTAIQGVCFGKTLASMSPRHEQFNLGMTLWHELAHVFHIQLSKNHVPRWFTEGLAEYETLTERDEWARERDSELYEALRDGRLPKIGAMNESFTRAEHIADIAVAYYASTQIVRMLGVRYGYPKLRQMLVLWGEGKRTETVVREALGVTTEQLDAQFQQYLQKRLARFSAQFVPVQRTGNPERVLAHAKENQHDTKGLVQLALVALDNGEVDAAAQAVEAALKLESEQPDALWLKGRIALKRGNGILAGSVASRLLELGHDGYQTQMLRARAAKLGGDATTREDALTKAHGHDPQQSEAIYGLWELARERQDSTAELEWLRALARLEEHAGQVYRALIHRLIQANRADEAVEVGASGVYADLEDPRMFVAYARALEAAGRHRDAEYQFESALRCPAPEAVLAKAHVSYAAFLRRRGQPQRADQLEAEARKLDPEVKLDADEG